MKPRIIIRFSYRPHGWKANISQSHQRWLLTGPSGYRKCGFAKFSLDSSEESLGCSYLSSVWIRLLSSGHIKKLWGYSAGPNKLPCTLVINHLEKLYHDLFPFIIIIIISIFTLGRSDTHLWESRDGKSPQTSSIFFNNLADINSAVAGTLLLCNLVITPVIIVWFSLEITW